MQCSRTEIGARIKAERQRMEWTRERMATAAGVSLASQSAYEAGTRVPDSRYLCRLAAEGVDILFLVCGYRATERSKVRWDVVATIWEQIEIWRADVGLPVLERGQREWLLARFYDLYSTRDDINVDEIRTVLDIAVYGGKLFQEAGRVKQR